MAREHLRLCAVLRPLPDIRHAAETPTYQRFMDLFAMGLKPKDFRVFWDWYGMWGLSPTVPHADWWRLEFDGVNRFTR